LSLDSIGVFIARYTSRLWAMVLCHQSGGKKNKKISLRNPFATLFSSSKEVEGKKSLEID
jgi:hypothetical protein